MQYWSQTDPSSPRGFGAPGGVLPSKGPAVVGGAVGCGLVGCGVVVGGAGEAAAGRAGAVTLGTVDAVLLLFEDALAAPTAITTTAMATVAPILTPRLQG